DFCSIAQWNSVSGNLRFAHLARKPARAFAYPPPGAAGGHSFLLLTSHSISDLLRAWYKLRRPHHSSVAQQHEIAVQTGNVPRLLRTPNAGFRDRLASHYAGFLGDVSNPKIESDVDIISAPDEISSDNTDAEEDVQVSVKNGECCFRH